MLASSASSASGSTASSLRSLIEIGPLGVAFLAAPHAFPDAMDNAPAVSPGDSRDENRGDRELFAPATPTMRLAVEMRPSFAPTPQAWNQAARPLMVGCSAAR